MNETPLTAQEITREFSDITEMAEREQIKLTPEVREYLHQWMYIITRKVEKGLKVTKKDMQFMDDVKLWMRMAKDWQEKYPSIEEMLEIEEFQGLPPEFAKKMQENGISLQQWKDILHLAANVKITSAEDREETYEKDFDWISRTFDFEENGQIIMLKTADCSFYESDLTRLPDNFTVKQSLRLDSGCKNLTKVPKKLKVEGTLGLSGTAITEVPSDLEVTFHLLVQSMKHNFTLPPNMHLPADLCLEYSKYLEELPEGLVIGENLQIYECVSLKRLPKDIQINGDIWVSENLNEQVLTDAERLQEEGKIKGKIVYHESLDLSNSEKTKIPKRLQIREKLNLSNSQISSLPDDLEVGSLVLSGSKIIKLSNNLKAGDYIDLRNTEIESLPDDLKAFGLLLSQDCPDKLKKDAEKLKEKGNIEDINYY